jgi:hypothetical protein
METRGVNSGLAALDAAFRVWESKAPLAFGYWLLAERAHAQFVAKAKGQELRANSSFLHPDRFHLAGLFLHGFHHGFGELGGGS